MLGLAVDVSAQPSAPCRLAKRQLAVPNYSISCSGSIRAPERMQNFLKILITRLNSRQFRRGVISALLRPWLRCADAALLEPGQLIAASVHRILILRPNHRLGNILLLTPLLAEIERHFPGAEIDVLAGNEAGPALFENFFSIRRVYTFPHFVIRHLIATVGIIFALRRAHYDLIIDPSQGSHSNRLLLGWIKPRSALGYPASTSAACAKWAQRLFLAPRHAATLPIFLLRHSLASSGKVDEQNFPPLQIRLTRSEKRAGQAVLNALLPWHSRVNRPVRIGIFANATGSKRFDKQWWLRLLRPLIDSHPDYAFVEFVAADGLSRLDDHFPTYYSSNPRKLAAVLSALSFFVSADCGIMHLACASGAPTLGLFCVTDLAMYGPYGGCNQSLETGGRTPEQIAAIISDAVDKIKKFDPVHTAKSIRVPIAREPFLMAIANTDDEHPTLKQA